MNVTDKNKYIYVASCALRSAALLASTGTLIQTFLVYIGMSAERIYIHTTVTGAVNVLVILLFARFADRGSLIRRTASVLLAGGVLFLCYLPLCFGTDAGLWQFMLLIAAGALQSVSTALHTVCDYKLPYYIIKKEDYGSITAFCGILYSGISFGTGTLMTALSVSFSYSVLMTAAFVIAFMFMTLAALLTYKLKNISEYEETVTVKASSVSGQNSVKEVITAPVFYKLLPANLMRGFATGMTLVFAVIAAENLGYSEQITTASVSVQSVASLAGCVLFGVLSKKLSHGVSIFAGSVTFLLLPLIFIPGKPVLFLIITGIVIFGRTLIDYAVPSMLLYEVPVEIAGPYNAYRMILHNGGSLIATTLATVVPVEILIPLACAMQIISGCVYMISFRKSRRTQSLV